MRNGFLGSCHIAGLGVASVMVMALWSAEVLSLILSLKDDTRHKSWKKLGAGRYHWKSYLSAALSPMSLWISDNLPAGPGLCLSWGSRCLHGLSRGSEEVRVQQRPRVRARKTKAWTSCVTHWLILHTERMNIWGFGIWGLVTRLVLDSMTKAKKTGKKIKKGREFCTFYCQRWYWTPRCGCAHAGHTGRYLKR